MARRGQAGPDDPIDRLLEIDSIVCRGTFRKGILTLAVILRENVPDLMITSLINSEDNNKLYE